MWHRPIPSPTEATNAAYNRGFSTNRADTNRPFFLADRF